MQNYVVSLRRRLSATSATPENEARLAETRMQRFADKLDRLTDQPDWQGHVRGTPCFCPKQNVVVLTCSLALSRQIAEFSNVKSVISQEVDGVFAA
ncbi:MAG: hypothetical protein Alpg2KO_15320 [Alphaproteobacteria bacterium]